VTVGVTAAAGFRAAGVAAGLKASGDLDVAVLVNEGPSSAAAGVVTRNRVKAAPVLWTEQVLTGGRLRAVVLNAGGANACTGPTGFADTHHTAEHLAAALGCGAGEVAVCSTGLIGERLPIDKLLTGVDDAVTVLSSDGGAAAANAIRTTDTVSKTTLVTGNGVTVGGMAKGAGMLAPGLATMLCVLTTDAVASAEQLDAALRAATRTTFDRVDTDGCMSTNDTVLLLASGASGVNADDCDLDAMVHAACADLALQLVADAEGASKDVVIEVVHAKDEDDAVDVGRAVARSSLLKCALFGNDPNWGRVLAAVGTTDAVFEPDQLDVAINDVWVCRSGAAAADRSLVNMTARTVTITIDLHAGSETAVIRTTDLTTAYVHENSAYSS
jgi:glutamate N-acetyltransferase / amino-acid N-acetyltransferase